MIEIDGSFGEGGGQILRSSLALSLVTGRPVTIDRIRKGRRKPGLMRQHLTCVRAATRVSSARVSGVEIGSTKISFRPKKLQAGDYTFKIGTAGSTTLVAQTVLPALMTCQKPSTITLEGGTHNHMAPPVDFIERAYLPLVAKIGPQITTRLLRHGFYPAGGGEVQFEVQPAEEWKRLSLLQRGPIISRQVRILNAGLPAHIAQRERDEIIKVMDWDKEDFLVVPIKDSASPGNVLFIEVTSADVTEVFTGFGRTGTPAESVAREALTELQRYLATDAAIAEHLADQLMLPLGISAHLGHGGGTFRTLKLSMHSQTHLEILKKFLDIKVRIEEQGDDEVVVEIR
jgi:RNA 3'-terminal phosphate cyclase (ATP)